MVPKSQYSLSVFITFSRNPEVSGRNPDKSGREDFFATSRLGEKLKYFRVVINNLRRIEFYQLCGHGLHTSEATAEGNPSYRGWNLVPKLRDSKIGISLIRAFVAKS